MTTASPVLTRFPALATGAVSVPSSTASPACMPSQRQSILHVQAVWRNCAQSTEALRNADTLKTMCMRLCESLEINVLGSAFFQFEPTGVAATIALGGSSIAIHTWPERNLLKAELQLNNTDADNDSPAMFLLNALHDSFQPEDGSLQRDLAPATARHGRRSQTH